MTYQHGTSVVAWWWFNSANPPLGYQSIANLFNQGGYFYEGGTPITATTAAEVQSNIAALEGFFP